MTNKGEPIFLELFGRYRFIIYEEKGGDWWLKII
jgi:hypothetical protein